jgi:hypothetical protein
MTWTDAFYKIPPTDYAQQALFMSAMLKIAADHPDPYIVSNLMMNQIDSTRIANDLDCACIPFDENLSPDIHQDNSFDNGFKPIF